MGAANNGVLQIEAFRGGHMYLSPGTSVYLRRKPDWTQPPRRAWNGLRPFANRPALAALGSLILAFLHASPAWAQRTWSGTDGNAWNAANNWGGTLPTSGVALVFGSGTGSGNLTLNNNLTTGTAWNVNGITFNAGAPAFVIGNGTLTANTGNTFTLNGNIVNNSTSLQSINTPLAVNAVRTVTTTTGGGDVTLGGSIAGSGGLTLSGNGTSTLAAANAYTGTTTLSTAAASGTVTLRLAHANALGSTSAFRISAGGTNSRLTLLNTTTSAIATSAVGSISAGNNPTIDIGDATTIAAHNLTFTGTGVVPMGGGSPTINLQGTGATLSFASIWDRGGRTATDTLTVNGVGNTLILGGLIVNGGTSANLTHFLTLAGSGNIHINGPISNGATNPQQLVVNRSGLTTFSGSNSVSQITLSSGTLRIASANAMPATTMQLNGGTLLNTSGGAISAAASVAIGSNVALTVFSANDTAAANLTFTGTTEIPSLGTSATITLNGNGTTLRFNGSVNRGVRNSSDTLTVNGAGNTLMLGGYILNGGTAGSQNTQSFAGTGNITIAGGISDGSTNPQQVIITSSGVVTFSGTNTYTGQTTLTSGVLAIASDVNLSGTASTLSFNGGTLRVTGTSLTTLNPNRTTTFAAAKTAGFDIPDASNTFAVAQNMNQGTGGLTKAGPGTLFLTGTNSFSGATAVNAGTVHYAKQVSLYNNGTANWNAANINAKSGATLTFSVGGAGEFTSGNVTTLLTNLASSSSASAGMNAGASLGFDTTNASGGLFTISDVIADTTGASGGARGLVKLGSGTLALTGANTYTGVTTVQAGALQAAANALANTSSISINGAFLSAVNYNPSAALTLDATGSARISGAGLSLAAVTNANTTANALEFTSATETITLASLSGAGSTRFRSGASIGGTISQGFVTIDGVATLATMAGGTVALGGGSGSITTLTGGRIDLVNNVALAVQGGTFGGTIAGTGSLTKSGAGRLMFTESQTYTGNTIISGGTLALGAAASLITSPTIVVGSDGSAGAVLDLTAKAGAGNPVAFDASQTVMGAGMIDLAGGTLRVAGTLAPGNSPGNLTVNGNLEWRSSDLGYQWEINDATGASGTNWDLLTVMGILDLSALSASNKYLLDLSTLTSLNAPGPMANYSDGASYTWSLATASSVLLDSGTAVGGTDITSLFNLSFSNWANSAPSAGNYSVKVASNGQGIDLVIVPEPDTIMFAGIGIATAGCVIWRRRRITRMFQHLT